MTSWPPCGGYLIYRRKSTSTVCSRKDHPNVRESQVLFVIQYRRCAHIPWRVRTTHRQRRSFSFRLVNLPRYGTPTHPGGLPRRVQDASCIIPWGSLDTFQHMPHRQQSRCGRTQHNMDRSMLHTGLLTVSGPVQFQGQRPCRILALYKQVAQRVWEQCSWRKMMRLSRRVWTSRVPESEVPGEGPHAQNWAERSIKIPGPC